MKGGNVCIQLLQSSLPLVAFQPTLQLKILPIGEYTYKSYDKRESEKEEKKQKIKIKIKEKKKDKEKKKKRIVSELFSFKFPKIQGNKNWAK